MWALPVGMNSTKMPSFSQAVSPVTGAQATGKLSASPDLASSQPSSPLPPCRAWRAKAAP